MSHLNAPLALASLPISYDVWRCELERICESRLSIGLDDLPDLPTQGAYDAGIGPAVFFEETVLPRLGEDDISFVDALEYEDLLDDPEAGMD